MFHDLEQKKSSAGTNTMTPDYCFGLKIVRNFNEKVEIDILLIIQILEVAAKVELTIECKGLKSFS
jgi:hypothetical protein